MGHRLKIKTHDESLNGKAMFSQFDYIEIVDNDAPELVLTEKFSLLSFKEYDLNYWLNRAARRGQISHMVKYCQNLDNSLVYPQEFQDQIHDGYLDLGIKYIPISVDATESFLPLTKQGRHKALLLDRDGVINQDSKYVYEYSNIRWVEGIVDLIKRAKEGQAKIVVLTNQSGIGRGYYSTEQMHELHEKMNKQLADWGCAVDEWFYCPFHTDGVNEYKGYSLLRKPFPAMALLAQEKLDLNLEDSVMIGDKTSDQLEALDIPTYFLKGHYDLPFEKNVFHDHFEIIEALKKAQWLY